jgi:hypothetical protein
MRRAKVDTTHGEIRTALRRCGWSVKNVHTVKGFVDMVAYHHGRGLVVLIDAKTNKGRLTEAQAQLVADGWPIKFVRSAEEAAQL